MAKILVVEDDLALSAGLCFALDEAGHLTAAAYTCQKARQLLKTGRFDLVILDVNLPDGNGFDICRECKSSAPERPVIFLTANDLERDELNGFDLGADDYITKPFHPAIVRARVNTHIKLFQYWNQVERDATVDQLTGVPNRRRYEDVSRKRWQDAIRLGSPISICMFDIDKFKVYNDTFGHPAGDKVIKAVAEAASALLRRGADFFARYGGEEFVALFFGGQSEKIFAHLKTIRQAIEDLHIPHDPSVSDWVTVSVGGVTVVPPAEGSYDAYLKIADTMLYDAKRLGRNQVVWADEQMKQLREK